MRISDWSSDVCSSDLRAHHFALDASHTRSGAPRDLGVAQVIDPVREEHIACEPGKREKCRLSAGEQFGVDGFVTVCNACVRKLVRSEEHTSELQSLMRISYAVFCLKKKTYKIIEKKPSHTLN